MHPRVVLVTDPAFGDDTLVSCVRIVARSLPRGALCVQLRDKRRPRAGLRLLGWRLRAITEKAGAWLVVNGEASVARDIGADGVHIGVGAGLVGDARSVCGSSAWVSVAAHSDDDVRAAVAAGASAVLVSAVFATRPPAQSGPAKVGRGIEALRSARAAAGERAAVYALGGVTADRACACIRAGADGVAVMRALLGSAEPARAARALHDAVERRC